MSSAESAAAGEPMVLVDRADPRVALVTLNRPSSLNGMSVPFVHEMHAQLAALAADRSCRVVILTGAGRAFSSGGDLADVEQLKPEHSPVTTGFDNARLAGDLMTRMSRMPQPVIAAVNGPAAGGGLALALGSDVRICTPTAKFNAAFVRIGLSGCEMGVSYLLPRVVGQTTAFEMMLTGRLVGADEALRVGLVQEIVPDVVARAREIAALICANSPLGVRLTKETMWANLAAGDLEQAMAIEARNQAMCTRTDDFAEALAAFRERRAPDFKDR